MHQFVERRHVVLYDDARIGKFASDQVEPKARAAMGEDGFSSEVGKAQRTARGEAVRCRDEYGEPLAHEGLGEKPLPVRLLVEDDKVVSLGVKPVEQVLIAGDIHDYAHARAVLLQHGHQGVGGERRARPERDSAPAEVERARALDHISVCLKCPLGKAYGDDARFIEGDVPARARKERHAKLCFQALHGTAERRLRDVKGSRRRGQRSLMRERNELLEERSFDHGYHP